MAASDLLSKLGYAHLMNLETDQPSWVEDFNNRSLAQSIKNQYESQSVTSMLINHPKLLLRKKTEIYPQGRTSYRFKSALRKKVTIVGKSAFNLGTQQ